jgi:hypothetical protein
VYKGAADVLEKDKRFSWAALGLSITDSARLEYRVALGDSEVRRGRLHHHKSRDLSHVPEPEQSS